MRLYVWLWPRYDIDGYNDQVKMYIWKKQSRQTFDKEGQTIHHNIPELYTKIIINFIFDITF